MINKGKQIYNEPLLIISFLVFTAEPIKITCQIRRSYYSLRHHRRFFVSSRRYGCLNPFRRGNDDQKTHKYHANVLLTLSW